MPYLFLLFTFFPFLCWSDPNSLVADLSKHLIAIHTDFVGTDIVLFGSADEGGHIIVTVKGPNKHFIVQRKEKTMGIWVNRTGIKYHNMPSFFRVASSAPLEDILSPSMIARYEFTPQNLNIDSSKDFLSDKYHFYKDALIQKLVKKKFYDDKVEKITFLGPHLFRTILHFPSNVPPGMYSIQVHLVRDNQVVAAQSTPLNINKVGISADLSAFARESSFLYGIAAIICAFILGAIGGFVLKRNRA